MIKSFSQYINESNDSFNQLMTDDEVNKIYYPFDDISPYDFDSKEEYENEIMRYKDNFTDAEIDYLKKSWPDLGFSFKYRDVFKGFVDKTIIKVIDKKSDISISIDKLTDEWYVIQYSSLSRDYKWYKCDQWDGLLDCLNFLLGGSKTFESVSEDLSLSDFLYLYLEDVKVYVKYSNIKIGVDKIDNEFGFQNFVDDYIYLANKNNQWIGGPLNREWANKYYQFFGLKSPYTDWKPTINVEFHFDDRSYFEIGFSILSKESVGLDWNGSDSNTIGFNFYNSLDKKKFNGKYWSRFTYDDYYDIIHRIIPNYKFNWNI